jgi:hypothetical protein
MTRIAAGTVGAALAVLVMLQVTPEPDRIIETEIVERTVILSSIDIDKQLADECIAIIVRLSGDPEAGVRHLVERHYNDDACHAAQEAISGNW